MFRRALHWLLSWARWVHCILAHSISFRFASILFSHLLVVSFIQVSPPNVYKGFSFPYHVRHNCVDLTTLIILDKNCRSGSYSLCSFCSLLSLPPSNVNTFPSSPLLKTSFLTLTRHTTTSTGGVLYKL
jgi:hypothetical protein